MEISFAGKRALVTGAGKGLGREVAIRLAKYGADEVIAFSRTQADLDSLAKVDSKITPICVDVGDWQRTKTVVKSIGPIDLLVNNAAVVSTACSIEDITEQDIDRVYDVNVKAVINITQEIAKGMKDRGTGGSIVNVSSVASLKCFVGGVPVYASSKRALDCYTQSMAVEYGPYNIRVNSVNPTFINTDMAKPYETSEIHKTMKERTPLRKFCEVEDCADPILFLLSDRAALITGVLLPIEGGITVCL